MSSIVTQPAASSRLQTFAKAISSSGNVLAIRHGGRADCGQGEGYYVELVERSHRLGLRYAQVKEHACQALAKRILRHEDEVCQF
jgi:hypothetical protein